MQPERALAEGRAVIVGIGAEGWASLGGPARRALHEAGAVVGSPHLLAQLPADLPARRLPCAQPDQESLTELVRANLPNRLVVLLSGDPLQHGPGRGLVEQFGIDALLFLPQPDPAARTPMSPGLPEHAYPHPVQDSVLLRALTQARLAPAPGDQLWQIGGDGAAAIEWMRCAVTCRAVFVQPSGLTARRAVENARSLGVPALEVVTGRAPGALSGLAEPDAVLLSGGLRTHGLIAACWTALRPGGRLVATATTVESESLLVRYARRLGGALDRLHQEHAEPHRGQTRWVPRPPVTQWWVTKPHSDAPAAPVLSHPAVADRA